MANKYKGQVELAIEDEDESITVYKLHYDANALVEIEDAMGHPINTLLTEKFELLSGFKFQRAALHYGLQRDPRGRKLTLKQCGDLLSGTKEQRNKVGVAVVKGVFLALGADIDALEREQKAAEEAAAASDRKKDDGESDPLGHEVESSSATGSN